LNIEKPLPYVLRDAYFYVFKIIRGHHVNMRKIPFLFYRIEIPWVMLIEEHMQSTFRRSRLVRPAGRARMEAQATAHVTSESTLIGILFMPSMYWGGRITSPTENILHRTQQ
jgi:hypothetical protein